MRSFLGARVQKACNSKNTNMEKYGNGPLNLSCDLKAPREFIFDCLLTFFLA